MTTDIEKQFFDMFGIEPIKRRTCSNAGDCPDECPVCDTCEHWRIIREDYPQITDHILLGLIRFYLGKFKIDRFRRFILGIWIDLYEKTINTNEKKRLKRRVQTLFKENN